MGPEVNTTDPTSVTPPEEFLNSPEVTETTIKDLVDKASLDLTDEEVHRLVAALRAARAQFAQFDQDKSKGNIPKGQKKPKAKVVIPNDISLDDLGINLDDL